MAVDERLNIIIDAETKEALAGFKDFVKIIDTAEGATASFDKSMVQLQSQLKSLKKSLQSATDIGTIKKLNDDIQKVTESIRKQSDATAILANSNKSLVSSTAAVVSSSNTVVTANNNAAKSAGNSSVAYMNFGRVLQDLPYGFNAISNNLTQLIPAAGGLGLAFTALTTAVTFMQIGFGAWTRGMGDSKKQLEELNKFTEEFAGNLAKEKTQLDTLFATATNANLPLEVRKNSIKELRGLYGNYLKNFTDEEILAGKAAKAYNLLSDAIIKSAKARAAQDQIVELQKKAITKEIELQKIAAKAQEDASKAKAERFNTGVPGAASITTTAEQARQGIFAEASRAAKIVADDIGEINKQIKTYSDLIQQNQTAPFKEDTAAAKSNATAAKKAASDALKQQKEIQKQEEQFNRRNAALKQQATVVPFKEPVAPKPVITQQPQTLGGALDAKTQQLLKQLEVQKQVEKQQADIDAKSQAAIQAQAAAYANLLFPAVDGVFNALQNGTSVTDALGDSFKKLAIDLAAAAAKAAILAGIMALINPAGAASGGLGFGKIFGSLLGFANGGIINKPTIGVVGERNQSEAVMPLSRLSGMLNMAANIGASSMGSSGEFVIRGNDLVLATSRANNSLNLRRG